jgi:hypothetical protein
LIVSPIPNCIHTLSLSSCHPLPDNELVLALAEAGYESFIRRCSYPTSIISLLDDVKRSEQSISY